MEKNYQTSYTNSQGQMFVARADTFEEFKKICEDMGISYRVEATRYDNRQEAKPNPEKAAQQSQFCTVHNTAMKQREYDGQTYYDHRSQIDGIWNKCRGKGWKADKPRSEFVSN